MQDHNVKQLGRISMYAKYVCEVYRGMHAGRAIVLVRIPGYVLKKGIFKEFITSLSFFCLGHQGKNA